MWKFQEVLNTDIAIMVVMVAGAACVLWNYVFRKEDIRVFNVFLFKLTLPASVIMGLGIKTDLYNGEIWRFVGAFLMLRAIMLAACTLLFGVALRRSLGEVTTNWLSTTWISTVILGTPLLKALLGPQFAQLGVVAGISSFIFQLPLMLIMYEVHAWRQENLHTALPEVQQRQPQQADRQAGSSTPNLAEGGPSDKGAPLESADPATTADGLSAAPLAGSIDYKQRCHSRSHSSDDSTLGTASVGRRGLLTRLHFKMTRAQGKRLGRRLLLNHVLWGVAIGIVLSLSTLGPDYLDPGTLPASPNCSYAVGAGFIYLALEYFARCTEPVAFLATGMWMVRKDPIATGWLPAAAYMFVKLVAVPALMVACCFAVGLEGAMARAAVLVATLPVSAAAFVLSKTYGVREDVAVTNVFLGNLLILPTTIAWLSFMDAVDLFPANPAKAPNPCAVPPKAG